MSAGTHLEMHRQHQQWLHDVLLWVEQANLWKKQNQQVAANLIRMAAEMKRYADGVSEHLNGLRKLAREIDAHQHAMAGFEATGRADEEAMLLLAKKHRDEEARHEREGQAHEAIKKRHHAVMGEWMRLLKEISRIEMK